MLRRFTNVVTQTNVNSRIAQTVCKHEMKWQIFEASSRGIFPQKMVVHIHQCRNPQHYELRNESDVDESQPTFFEVERFLGEFSHWTLDHACPSHVGKLTLRFFVDGQVRRHKCYETDQSDDVERYIDDVCDCTSAGFATRFQ